MKKHLIHRYRLLHRLSKDWRLRLLVLERSRRDIVWWFDHFAWTFDPREKGLCCHQPFVLYDFQRDFVKQLAQSLRDGNDLLVEKSRDMGVSWLVLLTFQYFWLFWPGCQFLVGSRKRDTVDKLGDLSTLLEKCRYNILRLPVWMQPKGFTPKRHAGLMKLINPENGNLITGDASTPNFGRGGRYKATLLDEFAFWANDSEAFASVGQATPSRIVVSTPYGKANTFAKLRFNSPIAVATLHWRQHPNKSEEWYQRQIKRMSPDTVARELDINYNLSVSNRVFSGFARHHIVDNLEPVANRRLVRSWDFGYHCPACVVVQLDDQDNIRVLDEIVGHQTLLVDFAQTVLRRTEERFEGADWVDICDPAGSQKTDKADKTSIELLNSLGVYPFYERSRILRGIELIRMKLAQQEGGTLGLLVHSRCQNVIDAFEGGYAYAREGDELPREIHPYEDVMDCLRYAVVHLCPIKSQCDQRRRRPQQYHRPQNPYTGY